MTFINSVEIKKYLENEFSNCSDFSIREMTIFGEKIIYIALIGNFSSRAFISDNLLKPLTYLQTDFETENFFKTHITASALKEITNIESGISQILDGAGLIFTDIFNTPSVFSVPARNDNGRSVSEPSSEVVVRGPREGFIESAETNIALLRKRIKTSKFKVEKVVIGEYTNTDICILYVEGISKQTLINEVKTRLSKIKLPGVIDSGYIEHFIQGKAYPLFSNVGNSEKPDKIAAKLLEGRVCIVCDGSPVVLSVPYLFVESIQSSEDYLKTPYYATFLRILRLCGLVLALYLPAIYITLLEHHKGAIPIELYLTIVKARENLPFGIFSELIIILLIFELVREVGLRIPRAVGDAVSIVGGLILGDAAIKAGIASSPFIIVASLTAISGFINPPYMNSTTIIRFLNIFAAKLFGLCGVAFSFILIILVLTHKNSFGYPYLYPFSPISIKGIRDGIIILPKKALKNSKKEIEKGGNYN